LKRKSSAGPDHFTLLIVPHTKQEAISLRMPHWALYICLLLVVASLVGLALLVRDYSVARSQLEALRQDRQVELDRQRAMRETILAQDEQVRGLSVETSRLNEDVSSMDRLIAEVRQIVGLDRLAAATNASLNITATVTATSTRPANIPGATSTPIAGGVPQEDRVANLAYAMGERQTAPAPSSRSLTAFSAGASLGSEDRAATTTLASRGATSAAIDSCYQVRAIQTDLDAQVSSLRRLRELVKERVSHVDADKRTDAATIEQQLRIFDAAPKLAPVKGILDITSPFGMRVDPVALWYSAVHNGIDIAAWWGVNVYSAAAGKVTYADWQGNLGWTIEIQHDLGFKTLYGHNRELVAHVGEQVSAGQLIARAGDTGKTTGPHVHYEIWLDGHEIDPMKYLDASASGGNGKGGAIVQP
jgi:murein DD-endopeptidase MepM/ murein hydrolase activator NlpD